MVEMTLLEQLGYRPRTPNAFQRGINSFFSADAVRKFFSWSVTPMDRLSLKLSGGKWTLSAWAGGQLVVWLEVVGRRTGVPRSVPLIAFPIEGNLAVIGSNFGRDRPPAWVFNLEANRRARVTLGSRTVAVKARPATEGEKDRIWGGAAATFPGYARYRERVTSREIKVFILESVDG